jgi:hypothetical protein
MTVEIEGGSPEPAALLQLDPKAINPRPRTRSTATLGKRARERK